MDDVQLERRLGAIEAGVAAQTVELKRLAQYQLAANGRTRDLEDWRGVLTRETAIRESMAAGSRAERNRLIMIVVALITLSNAIIGLVLKALG